MIAKNSVMVTVISVLSLYVFSVTAQTVKQWDIFELELNGPSNGNPFLDVSLTAMFTHGDSTIKVKGFYDGDGTYRIRFMPPALGSWSYVTSSNNKKLNNIKGDFKVENSSAGNHGPVRVLNQFHFAYTDETPFYPFGTTCYAWIHQPEVVQLNTLATLISAPFNKIRMCVFPKWYEFNRTEPERYPYEGTAPNQWDFWRFNPDFFRHLEKRIAQLKKMGIECDLILFHPYDEGHWGFDRMSDAQDDFYLRYIIARLSAYSNVWWSLANEYDFMKEKQVQDWDRFFKILEEEDPYNHLRSIHNGVIWYDHTNPLVTHLSIQGDPWENGGVGEGIQKIDRWKNKYKKPVIIDEMKYEGNIRLSFGDLTAREMTDRFWYTYTKGAYATHGETYINENDILWWSKGGKLFGESPQRIAFLKTIVESAPRGGFEVFFENEEDGNAIRVGDNYFLFYFGTRQPAERVLKLPETNNYTLEIIDTWEMTVDTLEGFYKGRCTVKLPGKPYIAVRAMIKLD